MTAIDCLISEHRQAVAEALERGWGPWRLVRFDGDVLLQRHRGMRTISVTIGSNVAADERLEASDVGHLALAMRDCAYAQAIGAGPWAKEGEE